MAKRLRPHADEYDEGHAAGYKMGLEAGKKAVRKPRARKPGRPPMDPADHRARVCLTLTRDAADALGRLADKHHDGNRSRAAEHAIVRYAIDRGEA